MFSGGNDAQAPQDGAVIDQTAASSNAGVTSAPQQPTGVAMPDLTQPEAAELPAIVPPAASSAAPATVAATDDLLGIKQQALQQLTPLLGHLDQSPEERFRTTMMMIQASDNSSLLKTAYEAAQQIGDEKTRAQALLDVVNEINYFTQHNEGSEPAAA